MPILKIIHEIILMNDTHLGTKPVPAVCSNNCCGSSLFLNLDLVITADIIIPASPKIIRFIVNMVKKN